MSKLNFSSFENLVNLFTSIKQAIDNAVGKMVSPELLKDTVGWTGKNKWNIKETTGYNATVTLLSNGFRTVVDNKSWGGSVYNLFSLKKNTDYILTCQTEIQTAGNFMRVSISGRKNGVNSIIKYQNYSTDTNIEIAFNSGDNDSWIIYGYVTGEPAASGDVSILNPMIRIASISDSTYEPYHESVEEELDAKMSYADNSMLGAKNLLVYPYRNTTKTENGITFTDNGDGSITIGDSNESQTASAEAQFYMINQAMNNAEAVRQKMLQYKDMILSGGISSNIYLKAYNCDNAGNNLKDEGYGLEFLFTNTSSAWAISIIVKKDTVISSPITIYPMLRLASDHDDTYVPYAMTNRELTDMMVVQESEFTIDASIIPAANITKNKIMKIGKIVFFNFAATNITIANAWTAIGTIPNGFRPYDDLCISMGAPADKGMNFQRNGTVQIVQTISNINIFASGMWMM